MPAKCNCYQRIKRVFIYCLTNFLKVATAYRLPRAADSGKSSEERIKSELEFFQSEIEKYVPKEQAKEITTAFFKLVDGKTSEETEEGFVSEILVTNPR